MGENFNVCLIDFTIRPTAKRVELLKPTLPNYRIYPLAVLQSEGHLWEAMIDFYLSENEDLTLVEIIVRFRESLLIGLFLILSAIIAALHGYISPDSWNYIELTSSISSKTFCQIDGSYSAVWPCGYPFVLAITTFTQNQITILILSKFVNSFMLFISYFISRVCNPNYCFI